MFEAYRFECMFHVVSDKVSERDLYHTDGVYLAEPAEADCMVSSGSHKV